MYDVPVKSYSGLKKKCKRSVKLPGIDLAHEKNAIFAICPFWLPLWTSLILYKIIDPQLARSAVIRPLEPLHAACPDKA